MTNKDREHFDNITAELKQKIKEENSKVFTNLYDDAGGINRSMIPFFEAMLKRIEDLEIFMFWSLICDAGEQGVSLEQKEIMRMLGWDKIFAKALGLPWEQLFAR